MESRRAGVQLDDMPWFHGKITRDEAETLLNPRKNGLFLVRESTHYPGDYTLCVCIQGKVEHYRIIYEKNQRRLTIDEEVFFQTLPELVRHYEEDADGLVSRLIKPVARTAPDQRTTDAFTKAGWSINRSEIHLGAELGKGNFGSVREATYKSRRVAIKMINDTEKAARSFLDEASIMTQLRHPNLVELIGVAIGNPIYIVLEYMSKGNLLDYLRTRGRSIITQKTQLGFAKNVCEGMKYLESKHFVHRDLAARNILISDRDIAKVSDFGLAQDDHGHGEGSSKIPVKWTAPEAVRQKQFSTKSDVWSFGVLMWELYSFGRVPYPRVPADEVILFIEEGSRMQTPDECPPRIFSIMARCWDIKPSNRPPFKDISDMLGSMDMPETSV